MPTYFECPDNATIDVPTNGRSITCQIGNSNAFVEIPDPSTNGDSDLYDLIFTAQFTQAERVALIVPIILFFATCWGYKALGKALYR